MSRLEKLIAEINEDEDYKDNDLGFSEQTLMDGVLYDIEISGREISIHDGDKGEWHFGVYLDGKWKLDKKGNVKALC